MRLNSYAAPPNSRATLFARQQRLRGLRGLPGLGDSGYPNCTDIDQATGLPYGEEQTYCNPPQPVSGPIPPALQNILTGAQAPQDPLSYVSPQAAIAAGLDPNVVLAAWTKGMAAFPTAQAAIDSGVPAGVVNQLFAASRSFVAPASGSWFTQNWPYLAAGAALLLVLGKRR